MEDVIDNVGIEDTWSHQAPPRIEGPRIYPHGYSLRVKLLCEPTEAAEALGALGWNHSSHWKETIFKDSTHWTVRGSTFLTQRRPRNTRLPLAAMNRNWQTCFYSVQIERRADTYVMDLHGVRRGDVEFLLEGIMGLSGAQPRPAYVVQHYRAAERYIVLSPSEAIRLGRELGTTPTRGRGRIARKAFLAKDLPVQLTIKKRSKRIALLSLYRIEGGATAAYKCEIRLAGKVRDRGQFGEEDIARLDDALLDLVSRHALTPLAKPARWEPRESCSWRRDARLEKLGMTAYRGFKLSEDVLHAVADCHPSELVVFGLSTDDPTACAARPCIRRTSPLHGYVVVDEFAPAIWKSVARDVLRNQGYLSEVVLDASQDPAPLVLGLCEEAPVGTVALQTVTHSSGSNLDAWGSVLELLPQLPVTPNTETLVIVIDPAYLWVASDALSAWDERAGTLNPGPLFRRDAYWDTMPIVIKAGAAYLWDTLRKFRSDCEESGLRVVLVTVDARPDHGKRDLLKTHFYRDSRVRSHIGDAGRYWTHTRYLVERGPFGRPRTAVLIKDEAEGLMGRVLYGR